MPDLSRLARQVASRPAFVAAKIEAYQRAMALNDAALAAQLHCSSKDLTHLRLCGFPRPDHFDEDVQRIADHIHVDATRLSQILHGER